jgi:nucleoside transporter
MSQNAVDYQSTLPAGRSAASVRTALSVMMFLEFFIWGAWYVSTAPYMTAAGMGAHIGTAYTLSPIAAIVAPFFLGMIADRFFPSEKVLAVMHLLGAAAMFAVPAAAKAGPTPFLLVILVHCVCFMPTINLTNSIGFANLSNQEKEFPKIRVFGTAGWIVANWTISLMKADQSATQYYIAGGAAVALAAFSLTLPHTPPPAKGKRVRVGEILGLDALTLFKSRSFAVFALCSFLISIPLAAYYSYAANMVTGILSARDPAAATHPTAAWMSIGQLAELLFMLVMPLFFARLGVKWMLAVGMLSWVVRYGLFAAGAPNAMLWVVLLGVALHGLCYDFFFVTGFIYTDKRAARQIRGQAQGLIVLITYGLGLGIGGYLSGKLANHVIGDATGMAALGLYQKFWMYPMAFAAAVLVLFVALFRDDSNEPPVGPDDPGGARGFEPVVRADGAAAETGAPR